MIGFIVIIIIVLIICSTFLFGFYMSCSKESGVGMFKRPTYPTYDEERLNELEQRIEMLENRNLKENI